MTDRIKYLVEKLNEAAKAYYQEDREILSNQEYDALYDELVALETWKDMEPRWDDKILEKMLPHVVNCHIHDNNGVTDQHFNLGCGNIDWEHISKLLQQSPRLKVIQSEVIPMRANAPIKDICEAFRRYF